MTAVAETSTESVVPATPALTRRKRRLKFGQTLAWTWIGLLVFLAVTASWLPIRGYGDQFVGGLHEPPKWSGWISFLGTDRYGRSTLSRVVYGGRVTLAVGILSVVFAIVIGGVLGLLAGYLGGRFDYVLTTITDALLAFPPIVFLLALRAVLVDPEAGRQMTIPKFVAILGALAIPNFYRQTRAQVLARRDRGYVLSAEAQGARKSWILFRELAPNVALPVISIGFVVMASLMIAEGSLSLLGFGLPEPQPSWGKMIADGKDYLQTGEHTHEMIIPVLMLFFTVFSLNVVGEAARKKFDTRQSRI